MTTGFRRFWAAGFTALNSIIPPGAQISPRSRLIRKPDTVGKAPGVRHEDGLWSGYSWDQWHATEADIDAWAATGAGVGIKCGVPMRDGWRVVAIDVDIEDPALVTAVRMAVELVAGPGPGRTGRAPRVLLPFRTREDLPSFTITSAAGNVDVLAAGKQFVADGIHPKTGAPYTWDGFVEVENLPLITAELLAGIEGALTSLLPEAATDAGGLQASVLVNQDSLVGPLDTVRRALRATPNGEAFKSRREWVLQGYALKAALRDHPAEARELWLEWCAKWTGGTNDPEAAAEEWETLKPPFRVGADRIYRKADELSGGAFRITDIWFNVLTRRLGGIIPARDWLGPIPEQIWIWDGWIPIEEVTLLYSPGGMGKTTLSLQLAIARALKMPFLGMEVRPGRTVLILCEDSDTTNMNRVATIVARLGADMSALEDLMIITLRGEDDTVLSAWDRQAGKMKHTPLYGEVAETVLEFGADLIVLDTIADIFGGDEIDRRQVNQFVKGTLLKLAIRTKAAVVALGHPSKAGQSDGTGTSGSTHWGNACRSRLYLEYVNPENRNVLRLSSKKANLGPSGQELELGFDGRFFELRPNAVVRGGSLAGSAAVQAACENMALKAIGELASEGVGMNPARNAGASKHPWVVLQARRPDDFSSFRPDELRKVIERLIASGRLVKGVVGRDPVTRKPLEGLLPASAPSAPSAPSASASH